MGPVFHWRSDRPGVVRGFTSRARGVSQGPYAGLNLGSHVSDEAEHVGENRRRLAEHLGVAAETLVFMNQVHGDGVAVVDAPPRTPPTADALVTTRAGLVLAVLVADCVPVLLASVDGSVVGAVHAGRQGLLKGVVRQAVSCMRDLGADDLTAVVGPSVCARCYEVPAEMRAEAALVSPAAAAVSWSGTPAIDIAAGVVSQLADLGVAVEWVPGCTREDAQLFSHRRDGVTGRFAGVVGRQES